MAGFEDGRYASQPTSSNRQTPAVRMQNVRAKLPGQLREPQSVERPQTGIATHDMHSDAIASELRQQWSLVADGQVNLPTALPHPICQPEDMALRPSETAAIKDQ